MPFSIMSSRTLRDIPSLKEGDTIHVYYRVGFIFKPKQTFTILSINFVGDRVTIRCGMDENIAYLSYSPNNNRAYLIKEKSIVKVADVRRA